MTSNEKLSAWSRQLAALATTVSGEAAGATTPGSREALGEVALSLRRLATEIRGDWVDPNAARYPCAMCNSPTKYLGVVDGPHRDTGRVTAAFLCLGGLHHRFSMDIPAAEAGRLQDEQELREAATHQ